MKITIREVLGCRRADIMLAAGRITMVGGDNLAGKTSLREAVIAGLTGSAKVRGVTKKVDAQKIVNDGAKAGYVEIRTETGSVRVDWPANEYKVTGEPDGQPNYDPMVIGALPFARAEPDDRARLLVGVLKAEPTLDELAAAVADLNLSEESMAGLWKQIQTNGWDATHAKLKDSLKTLKGGWEAITHERYGPSKAEGWMPPGFDHDIRMTLADYEQAVAVARTAVERAVAMQAVSEDNHRRLTQTIKAGEEAATFLTEAQAELDKVSAELERAVKERDALPATSSTTSQSKCPHCQKEIAFRQVNSGVWKIEAAAEPVDEKTLKERRIAFAKLDGTVSNLNGRVNSLTQEIARHAATVQRGQEAATELAEAEAQKPSEEVPSTEVAREKLIEAERALANYRTMTEAGKQHMKIVKTTKCCDVVAPDGLRAAKLGERLGELNGRLAGLSADLGIATVLVAADMTVTTGGREYGLLGESEQWRTDVALAIAISQAADVNIVLVDRADMLNIKARGMFINALRKSQVGALVTMTLKEPESLPPLESRDLGWTYWIENGVAERARA
jgi:hypothetical protein